ncbi:hypothetical protein ACOSP7_025329 [Xanthoceras sorbifolium]
MFRSSRPSEEDLGVVLNLVCPTVTHEMNIRLLSSFTRVEVEVDLNQMASLKALEPDGLPAAFYQKFWDVGGADMSKAVLAVLNDYLSLGSIGDALVVLIPKVKVPSLVSEFKPINLYNIVYKLIAKVIANMLKPILDSVISKQQSAFVQRRLISDNIVGFKCLHTLRNKRRGDRGHIALKLDMSKAYDRVEWCFLQRIMGKLGFHETWVRKVLKCHFSFLFLSD